jgi:hypothetical protein
MLALVQATYRPPQGVHYASTIGYSRHLSGRNVWHPLLTSLSRGQRCLPGARALCVGQPTLSRYPDSSAHPQKSARSGGRVSSNASGATSRKAPNDPAHLAKLADIKHSDYDVLLFYTSGYNLNDAQERALERFVEDGGGIVAIHGASGSFGNSKVWLRLLGAKFTGHIPGTHMLNVVILDSKHPITAGVGNFSIVDEEYKHRFAEVDKARSCSLPRKATAE